MKLTISTLLVSSVISQSFPHIAQCNFHKGSGQCNAAKACTWCAPAAMPGGCYRKSFAKSLPSGVFTCASGRDQNMEMLPGSTSGQQAGMPGDVSRRMVGAMLGTGALGMPFESSAASADIKLVTFNGESGTNHRFNFEADPVMAGASYGSSFVEDGKLTLKGYCAYRPFLTQKKEESSAYIRTETADQKFPDVSACEGIAFVAKAKGPPFGGYQFCIGGNRAGEQKGKLNKRTRLGNQCYKSPFKAPNGVFETVQIPFTDFTNFWDPETGGIVRNCKDSPKNCPDTQTLTNIKDMSIWAEGDMGDVFLEIKEISAYGCAPAAVAELSVNNGEGSTGFVWLSASALLGLLVLIVVRSRTRSTLIAPALLG
eukprot:gnl/MRDRNA2_/MRDRNA2_77721_c0_seq1.p1 gnl/MRDRNA2_/MRDRNA2_77721_c0~~gnl/MRDRNA2_/MRDRNA2_77721_c0_seq1.p1  ORF type:complete len:370 (+),score=61.53 gnl/MRDRNA2_/MRDRNA2_77721_c0_seq1:74-1183(+)